MCKFEKGNTFGKGRPKGVKNERTLRVDALIDTMIETCEETLVEDLGKLEPKERIDALLKLLEYKVPKLQRTTIGGDSESEPIKFVVDFKNSSVDDLTKLIETTEDSNTD